MGRVVRDPVGRREVRVLSECRTAKVIEAGLAKAVSWGHLRPKSKATLQKEAGVNPKQAPQLLWFRGKEVFFLNKAVQIPA